MKKTLALLFSLALTGLSAQTTLITESGYRLVKHRSTGAAPAKPGDLLKVNAITTIGDSVLMNTQRDFGGPRELMLPEKAQIQGQKIPAILEAAYLLGKGDSATIFQPIDSTMRAFLPPNVQSAKEIRFDLVVVDLITAEQKAAAAAESQAKFAELEPKIKATVADFVAGKLTAKVTATASGLKMLVVEKGAGAPVKAGENVMTHYYGLLLDGNRFDDSFSRGEPLGFQVAAGQMIAGFDEGVQQLHHGGKAYLFLPYQLAYGEAGMPPTIPAKADLVFYVEVQ
jgi:FKBP-type peptidyl-prolyl cis-trans isomerase FkpA